MALATGDGMKPTCHPFQHRLPPFIGGILSFFLFVSALYPPPVLEGFIPPFYPIYPSHLGGNIVPAASGSVNPKRPLFYCYPPLWGGKVFNLKNVFNKLKIN